MAITFKVGFQLDDKELNAGLAGVQKNIQKAFNIQGGMSDEIQKATQSAMVLEKALKRATTDKGISYHSLQSELHKAGTTAAKLTTTLAGGGDQFKDSLNAANTALALSNRSVISLNRKIQEMSRVMVQSFKFTTAQAALRSFSSAAQQAYRWVVDLDAAVNQIGVVTGKTSAELDAVTVSAVEGARRLKVAAKDYAEGALIFYQQGLNDEEVTRRNEITIKAAKAAGQSVQQMSSQLTAIWNTYGMVGDEQARAASVGAKMAAQTAVDFQDIAQAMQTAAAPAAQMGVSYDSLAAIIATVGDTTQQSASVIGNAFKTIFSRFQQLKSAGTDGEVTLNRVSQQLQELGVHVLDGAGNLRQLDEVITEVGNSWDSWSSKQQLAIAQLVGGTRQYGQFLALMNNFDKYQANLQGAKSEDGSALEQQYTQALDSIEEHAKRATESWRRSFDAVFDPDTIKGFYKISEDIGDTFGRILESVGGLPGILTIVGGLFANKLVVATANMAHNVHDIFTNLTAAGRMNNITKDFTAMDESLNEVLAKAKASEELHKGERRKEVSGIDSQMTKNAFGSKVAVVNEKINNKLENATGANKINLEYMLGQVKAANELYQTTTDQLAALRNETKEMDNLAARDRTRLENQQKSLTNQRESATTNLLGAQDRLTTLQADPKADPAAIAAARSEVDLAQKSLDQLTNALAEVDNKLAATDTKTDAFRDSVTKLNRSLTKLSASTRGSLRETYINYQKAASSAQAGDNVDAATKKKLQDSKQRTADKVQEAMEQAKEKARTEVEGMNGKRLDGLFGNKHKLLPENFEQELAKFSDLSEEAKQQLRKLHEEMQKEVSGAIQRGTQEMLDYTEGTRGATAATKELEQSQKILDTMGEQDRAAGRLSAIDADAVKDRKKYFSQVVEGVGSLTGALTMGAGAARTFWSAMKDSDAGFGEKVMAFVTAVSMLAPVLSMAKASLDAMNISIHKTGITILGTTYALKTALPIIALVSAAIAALIAIGKMLWDDYKANSPEGKLESAKKAAEGLHSELDQVTASADKLRETFDRYKEAEDKLNHCTRGTQEWKDALKETNAMAEELLANLPDGVDASGLFNRDEHGVMRADQNRVEEIQEESDRRVKVADLAATLADAQVEKATQNVAAHDIARDINKANGRFGWVNADNIADSLGSLAGLDFKDFKTGLAGLGIAATASDTKLKGLQEQVDNFSKTVENANGKIDAMSKLKIDQLLGDDFSGTVKDMVGSSLDEETAKIADSLLAKYTGSEINKASDSSNAIAQQMLKDYNAATGKNWALDKNAVRGSDDKRTFAFLDEVGELHELTAQQVASTIAASKALEELTGNAKEAQEALDNFGGTLSADVVPKMQAALENYISNNNFDTVSENDLNNMVAVNDAGEVDMETSKANILEAFGGEESLEAVAAIYGQTVDQFVADMAEAAVATHDAFGSLGQDLPERIQNVFQGLDLGDLSLNGQKELEDMIVRAFVDGGSDGAKKVEEFLNTAFDANDPEEFMTALSGIDWQTTNVGALKAALEAAGIVTEKFTNENLADLISMMKSGAEISLSSAQSRTQTIDGVADGLSFGDTISQEDMDALGPRYAEFFTQLQDGTWALTESAEKFHAAVKDESDALFGGLLSQIETQKAAIGEMQLAGDNFFERVSQNAANMRGPDTAKNAVAQDQINYLRATGYSDETNLAAWTEGATQGNLSAEEYQAIADAIAEAGDQTGNWNEKLQEVNAEAQKVQDAMWATDFLDSLEEVDLDPTEVEEYAEHLADVSENSEILDDELKTNSKSAKLVARDTMRLNRGLDSLADGFEDWSDVLKKSDKSSLEYAEALGEMRNSLSDVLGVEEDLISDDFVSNHLSEIEAAASGSQEAIDNLHIALATDVATNALEINLNIDHDKAVAQATSMMAEIQQLMDQSDIKVGTRVDVDNEPAFLEQMQNIVTAAGMTAEQANAFFSSMGFEAEFETETKPIMKKGRGVRTVTELKPSKKETYTDEDGNVRTFEVPGGWEQKTYPGEEYEYLDYVDTFAMATNAEGQPTKTPKIKSLTKTSGGSMSNFAPHNSGGPSTPGRTGGKKSGGTKPKPKDPHSKTLEAKYEGLKDRYSSLQSAVDKTSRAIDKFSNATEDAVGPKKLANMKALNKEYQNQGKHLDALIKKAKDYAGKDRAAAIGAKKDLKSIQTKSGKTPRFTTINTIDLKFNDDGFLANRTEVIDNLDRQLEIIYNKWKNYDSSLDGKVLTDAQEQRLADLKGDYEETKKAVDEYIKALDQSDETAQKVYDTTQEALENVRTWMTNKVEEANYKMEFNIGFNDRDLAMMEFMLDKLGDTGKKTGKSFDLLKDSIFATNKSFYETNRNAGRMIEILDNIDPDNPKFQAGFKEAFGEDIWKKYLDGNGALPAEVWESIESDIDSMMGQMDDMYGHADEMLKMYIEVFEMYMEDFDRIGTQIENNVAKLEMYNQLLEFSGKQWGEEGRESSKNILAAQMSNAKTEVTRAKAAMDFAKQAAEETHGQLKDFYEKNGTDPAKYNEAQTFVYERLKNASDEAKDSLAEAENTFTGSIQDLATAAAEAMEKMAQIISDEASDKLGGLFYDTESMMDVYDNKEESRTFFLEDYDKEYQLNDLLAQIDKQMEDVTDPDRLKQYEELLGKINEKNKEGVKITQTDVDLLKAQFEIQKAQDEYSDARAAKNTMRLSRDASGNWNYVYSGEEGSDDEATRKMADAQYQYEKLLHDARDLASKNWLQAQQDFKRYTEEVDWARYEHDLQYRESVDATLEFYREKTDRLHTQVIEYNNALGENYADTTLGIVTNTESMESAQTLYGQIYDQLIADLKANTQSYQDQVRDTCEDVGINYTEMEITVNEETSAMMTENDNLKQTIEDLKTQGSAALSTLNSNVTAFKQRFIEDMVAAKAAVQDLIDKLRELRDEQAAKSMGYDEGTDYSDYLATKFSQEFAGKNVTEADAAEWLMLHHSDDIYERINAAKDRGVTEVGANYDEEVDRMAGFIVKAMKENPDWLKDGSWNYNGGVSGKTATGGLIKTPQIRSLAEEGPELVLNADDTKNILAAVQMMRSAISSQLAVKVAEANAALHQGIPQTTSSIEKVEQEVHIEASFPGVSVADEIEDALNNLIEQAAQYVIKK